MSNSLTTPRQPLLTRGRLLVGLPFGLGFAVSAAVVLVAVLPLAQALRELEARRDTLLNLQRSLPVLERQLAQAQVKLLNAADKQALLVGLLAGNDSSQTFLALLNQQALASGVQMQRYEPLKPAAPPSASATNRNNNRSKTKQKTEPPQDPLQALGYRKSSVALEVSGPFRGLQTFLQRMEALELLVESSELELKAVVDKKAADSVESEAARTQLTLKLSFYDLAPVANSPANGAKPSPS